LSGAPAARRAGSLLPLDALSAAVVVLIWGLNFVVGKVGVAQFPPLFMMAMRFSLVALLLSPFLRRPGRPFGLVVALGVVFGGFHFGLLFAGLKGVDAGVAAVAMQLGVPFSALLAAVFFHERLGAGQLAGMLIAISGVGLLAGAPRQGSSLLHVGMLVCASFAWAVGGVLVKRLAGVPVFVLNAWVALLAAPQLLAASLALERGQRASVAAADLRGWGALLYTAVGASIVAYGLWYRLLARYDIGRVVPLTLLAPVLAVALAALLLGEPVTPRLLLGGGLVIGGVWMVQRLRPSPAQ
jgi:O-acetylserine/cysteine efflux transporter